MSRSFMSGVVLANYVGMGKTLTLGLIIIMNYISCCSLKAKGKSFLARPVIWPTQANLVTQTDIELYNVFGSMLAVHCYYGNGQSGPTVPL